MPVSELVQINNIFNNNIHTLYLSYKCQTTQINHQFVLLCSNHFDRCSLSRPHYTITVYYSMLYMTQVPGDCYLYTRRLKHTCILYVYLPCAVNVMTARINFILNHNFSIKKYPEVDLLLFKQYLYQ